LEFKEKRIKLKEVESIELIKLRWLGGFGGGYTGFGKRRIPWKKQISYIMNRNFGCKIVLKNGKIRFFTTEREAAFDRFIKANMGHFLIDKTTR